MPNNTFQTETDLFFHIKGLLEDMERARNFAKRNGELGRRMAERIQRELTSALEELGIRHNVAVTEKDKANAGKIKFRDWLNKMNAGNQHRLRCPKGEN